MIRRILAVLAAFMVLSSSGCGLLGVLMVPFQLLFEVIGGVFDVVGQGLDAVVLVEPIDGPAPTVRLAGSSSVVLTDVVPGSRFRVTFATDAAGTGHEAVVFAWPEQAPAGWEDAVRATGAVRVPLTLTAPADAAPLREGSW
jgi:hypothetical protein